MEEVYMKCDSLPTEKFIETNLRLNVAKGAIAAYVRPEFRVVK